MKPRSSATPGFTLRPGALRRLLRSLLVTAVIAPLATGCGPWLRPRSEASATAPSATIGSQAACLPSFPDRDGWFGGDAATSVVLPGSGGRASLWLFGDSFVARSEGATGRTYPFVHNSIAVSRCEGDGRWRIDYAWRASGTASPRAFFEPDPGAAWVRSARRERGGEAYYWPIAAARLDETIVVALLRVVTAEARGPLRLPFRLVGVDLARLSRLERSPEAWRIRYSTLSDRTDAFPASSLVVEGESLHAFAFLDGPGGAHPRILTRVPLARIAEGPESLEDAIETWTEDGRWIPGLVPERARLLMDDSASEMSVHFDPALGEWLAVYAALPSEPATDADADARPTQNAPAQADAAPPADFLRLRRARSLTGPWSAPAPLLRLPELAARPDALPGELFCYAGKAHPELAPGGELLVSWVCNLEAETAQEIPAVLERLRKTPSIYRPRTARIPVPPEPPTSPQT